jgi:hypothetical protein
VLARRVEDVLCRNSPPVHSTVSLP